MNRNDKVKAIILAAGVGSGLSPLTNQKPTALLPIANMPTTEHAIELLALHSMTDICVHVHYKHEEIIRYFGDGLDWGIDLNFAHLPMPTGDVGAIFACHEFVNQSTFLVMMGDILTNTDLTRLIAKHKETKALATIAFKRMPRHKLHNFDVVLTNNAGYVTEIQSRPSPGEARSDAVLTGIYIFEPEVFLHLASGETNIVYGLLQQLLAKGLPIFSTELDGYWTQINTIDEYRKANFDVLNGLLDLNWQKRERKHCTAESSSIQAGSNIKGQLILGRNSQISSGCLLTGSVIIGDNCAIGPDVCIHDSIIWSNTRVYRAARIENCVICSNCIIKRNSVQIDANSTPSLEDMLS